MPPKQEPDNSSNESSTWNNWQDHRLPEKSSEFEYKESTAENIGGGESQRFHYGNTDEAAEE